ncbi:MAG TPA: hypothetical protein VIG69_11220 [Candidatus Methylomirabilis sp.]
MPRVHSLLAIALLAIAAPLEAHHLGVIVPRDDEVTVAFKRVRGLVKEGRFDLASRECEAVPLGPRLAEASRGGPPDVRGEVRGALARRDAPGTELALLRFFLVVVRDLAGEALRRVNDPGLAERAQAEQALKLLAAGWRYYNLVDYTLYQREAKAALRARLAFEDIEFALGGSKSRQARYDAAAARLALEKFRALLGEILAAPAPARGR